MLHSHTDPVKCQISNEERWVYASASSASYSVKQKNSVPCWSRCKYYKNTLQAMNLC